MRICSNQFYFGVFIESQVVVILCGVELLVGGTQSTTTDVVHLGVCVFGVCVCGWVGVTSRVCMCGVYVCVGGGVVCMRERWWRECGAF